MRGRSMSTVEGSALVSPPRAAAPALPSLQPLQQGRQGRRSSIAAAGAAVFGGAGGGVGGFGSLPDGAAEQKLPEGWSSVIPS